MSPSSRSCQLDRLGMQVWLMGMCHYWNARHGAKELSVLNISAGSEAEPFHCPSSARAELQHV